MAGNWIAGALMGHTLDIEGGPLVRVRLARSSDARAIAELLARQATPFGDVDVLALLQYDPRERYVICATALIDGLVTLVGVGAIDLLGDEMAEPDLLVVDPEFEDDLARLLWRLLVGTASAAARRAA
jgi:hypothetical protein